MATPKKTRRRYSQARKDEALMALILTGDSPERASKLVGIPKQTLHDWKREHAARYAELQRDLAPQIADRIAADAEALALKIGELEAQILQSLDLDKLDNSEKASVLRNLTASKSLQIDKLASPLRGRPTQIIEHRDLTEDVDQLLKDLNIPIPTTATDLHKTALPDEIGLSPAREVAPGVLAAD